VTEAVCQLVVDHDAFACGAGVSDELSAFRRDEDFGQGICVAATVARQLSAHPGW
jgi:hypothetical protein